MTTTTTEQSDQQDSAAKAILGATAGNGVSDGDNMPTPTEILGIPDPDADTGTDPDDAMEVEAAPPPASRRRSSARKPALPRTPAPSAQAKKLIGATETFRFYKIDELGKSAMVGNYKLAELMQVSGGDVETFIQQYLIPTYKEGEYCVKLVNGKNVVTSESTYRVLAPWNERPAAPGLAPRAAAAFEQQLIAQSQQQLAELQAEQRKAAAEAQRVLAEQNAQLMAQMTAAQQKSEGGGSSMMMMMMMMGQQQQAAAAAAQRAADLKVEEMRMKMEMEANRPAPPPPPMPPPPPPGPGPMEMMQMQMQMMSTFQQMTAPKDDPFQRLLLEKMMMRMDHEPKGITDTIQEMNQVDEVMGRRYGGGEGVAQVLGGFFENFADNMRALKEVIVAQPQPGAPAQVGDGRPSSPPLPEEFLTEVAKLDDAEGDQERIETVLASLGILRDGTSALHKLAVDKILTMVIRKDKPAVLAKLKELMKDLVRGGLVTEQASIATYRAFDRHFDLVAAHVAGQVGATEAQSGDADEGESAEDAAG